MAAKQGLTAHISQASEDARRAVLSRAPTSIKSHSWLSNLNTTCTIKSAPPRTPGVMTLLSVKSGWLVKRNEQQVWQRRWCCVVPHTFLYYFEAEPLTSEEDDEEYATTEGFNGGGVYRSEARVVENQDVLNTAVRDGYSRGSRSTTPLRSRGKDDENLNSLSAEKSMTSVVRGPTTTNGQNLLPAGIIDLECYSSVNRCPLNDCIFELTGDEITNPDLRSFFFQAGTVDDCEVWTKALVSDRHSALRDEREAYRQVCDSFQLQLQSLSDMIDEAEEKTSLAENQLYTVRSAVEKTRNKIVNIVREAFEHKCWLSDKSRSHNVPERDSMADQLEKSRLSVLDQVDKVLASANTAPNNSVTVVVQLLANYMATIIRSYDDLKVETTSMEQKLNSSANIDKATVSDLKAKIGRFDVEKAKELAQYKGKITGMESQLHKSQRLLAEAENHIQTQQVEAKMFQNHAKTKLQELSQHKKILKKEVIDLRKKNDEIGSERDAASHKQEKLKLLLESEQQKNAVLEKYIEKIENQVSVQQNMMEMISLTGSFQGSRGNGSVVGKMVGPDSGNSTSSAPRRTMPSNGLRHDSSPLPNRLPPSTRSRPTSELEPAPSSPPKSTSQQNSEGEKIGSISPLSPPISSRNERNQLSILDSYDPEDPSILTPRFSSKEKLDVENDRRDKDQKEKVDCVSDNEDIVERRRTLLTYEERATRYQRALKMKDNERKRIDEHPGYNGLNGDSKTRGVHGNEDESQKSHISELTEDRTQRQIAYAISDMTGENNFDQGNENQAPSFLPGKVAITGSEVEGNKEFPPRYIGTESALSNDQDGRIAMQHDIDSGSSKKLSVAQRSRIEANTSNSVKVAVKTTPTDAVRKSSNRPRSESPSVLSSFSDRIIDAIDNSIIGVKTDDNTSRSKDTESKEVNSAQLRNEPSLTLEQRRKLQRQRQLNVLKSEGVIKEVEGHVNTGGARTRQRNGGVRR